MYYTQEAICGMPSIALGLTWYVCAVPFLARLVNSRSVVLVALHGGIRTVPSLVQREGTDKATYSVPSVAIERVRFMHAWKKHALPHKKHIPG